MRRICANLALAMAALLAGVVALEGLLQVAALAARVVPTQSGPSTQRRVLAIGDSNVYGLYVARSATWPAQLARRLNVEVVNAGVPGMDTARLLGLLPSLLAEHRPTDVVVLVGANDLWAAGSDVWWRRLRVARLAALLYQAVVVDRPDDVDPERPRVLRVGGELVDVTPRVRAASEPAPATRENVAAMLRLIREASAQPYVLTYGSTRSIYAGMSAMLREVARQENATLIDGTVPEGMTFPDGHPTAAGYGVVAEKVAGALGK